MSTATTENTDSPAALRWGLLGAGNVVRQFARSVALLPEQQLTAVASRSKSRAESLKAEVGVKDVSGSYEALVQRPDINAIYIATPAALHRSHALLAISAGKHVLIEKPFASSVADAIDIVTAARARGVFCMEAMWMRFIPAIRALRSAIEVGDIGTPQLLQADLGFATEYEPTSRYFDPALGGGVMLDLGVYLLSLAWFVLGRPESGQALTTNAPSGVDAQAAITLRHSGGGLSNLTCSFNQRLRNSAVVSGTKGSFELEEPLFAPTRLVHVRGAPAGGGGGAPGRLGRIVETQPQLVALRRRFAPVLRQVVRRERTARHLGFLGFGYQFEAEEVARCVQANLSESPSMPLDESIEILRALEALRTAGRFEETDLVKTQTA